MSTSRGCRAAATLAGTLLLGSLIIDLNALPGVRAAGDAPAEDLRLPPDLIYDSEDDSPDAVVFRHSSHVAFTDTDCLACHPQPFKMLNPDRRVSHAEMDAGRQCGICHDGDNASGTADGDACTTCHTGVQAAPRDVVLAAGSDSPGPVTFRHATHGEAGAVCADCHPRLFAMKAGAAPLDKEAMLQGATCGACHDGRRTFGVDDADACELCHAPEGDRP